MVVRSGRPVIIDASFRSRWMRNGVRKLAASERAPFLMIECVASSDRCIARLNARHDRHESDARADLFEEFAAFFEPMTELAAADYARIDTSLPIEETTQEIERILGASFEGLTVEPRVPGPENSASSTGTRSPA